MVDPPNHDDGPSACAVLGYRSGVVEYAGHPCCYAVSAGKYLTDVSKDHNYDCVTICIA